MNYSVAKDLNKQKEQLRSNLSLVHIYFKELGVVKYERDERYSVMDVIDENDLKESIYLVTETSVIL